MGSFSTLDPARGGGFGGPSLRTSTSFGGISGGFGGSAQGPSNAYLPPRRGSGDIRPHSTEFGNQTPSSLERHNINGAPQFADQSAGLGPFQGFPSGPGNVPVSGGGRYGQGTSGTYDSSAFERNVFGGKGPSGKYGAPDSRRSGFGGQGPSGGRPAGTHDASTFGSSEFGGHRPSVGRPSGTYGAPTSGGSDFGAQGSSGKEPSGTYDATSGGSGFSGPYEGKRFGGRPFSADGAPSSSSGDPSNIYLPTAGGVGKTSQLSGGSGTQSSRIPFSFHEVPGLSGGYNGSPNGPSNTYLPSSGGIFGHGPSRNSGSASGQFSGTYSSSNAGGSSRGRGRFSDGNDSGFGVPRTSNLFGTTLAGGPIEEPSTLTGIAGGFNGPSNAYLPPSSNFNYQGSSGSGTFGGPKHGGNDVGSGSGSYRPPNAFTNTNFSASLDSPFNNCESPGTVSRSNDDIGFRGSLFGPSNTYLSPGSGGSSDPSGFGRLSSKYRVPNQEGVFDQRLQDGSNSNRGLQRNIPEISFNSYGTSSQGSGSGRSTNTHGVPSQGQQDNSAFEGYKY
ncbi:filaggrin-2-like isoform X2 [Zootermopsis nevadensis]|nr:filaggrin-2-like isoform X2 [Zootermopsis nevadensis]XP_021918537.1 filaggrin-2-like isoform X2 [Zootermopsis nevadensis]